VASTAAASLGKTRVEASYDALVKALGRESHIEVIRAGAMNGLAELKGDTQKKARKVVTAWTAYGRPARAREAAISALGRLGYEDRETVDRLVDLLDDRWYRARLFAIHALEELKEPEAVGAIQRLAGRERDGRVVRSAREAVASIRAGRKDDTTKLREDFNKLEEENRKLRERLDKVEQKVAPAPDKKKASGAKAPARRKAAAGHAAALSRGRR
jgi:aminopeptidase N